MNFNKYPENPIYGQNLGTAFDAYVTKVDGKLRMDFSWRPKKALAVSFSDDGIHWTEPQITLAYNEESGFEDNVNRNCVLRVDGKWKMWYTGQAHGAFSYICYAESDDGIHFHRVGDEPIMVPEYPYENASVMNPCVLFEDGVYKMWYSAGETYEPNVLCYAESKDGIHWTKRKANPIFIRNEEKEYEANRVGGCQILRHKDLGYLLFYIGYKDINTACICVATSKNGLTGFRRFKGNPIVFPKPGDFDSEACYKPTALYSEEKKGWDVWYNGRTGAVELIGGAFAEGDFKDEDFE